MTEETSQYEHIVAVLRAFDDSESHDSLWWRVIDGQVRFLINCNDLFFWGTADCEELNADTLPIYEACVRDLGSEHNHNAPWLYCCRVRKERPQGACYKYIDHAIRPLFDACGPEKATGFGNPRSNKIPYMFDNVAEPDRVKSFRKMLQKWMSQEPDEQEQTLAELEAAGIKLSA